MDAFTRQIVRELTDASDGVLCAQRFLICERHRRWSAAVRQLLETSAVRVIRTPFCAPNCNAHAERFVRSVKAECLDRLIPVGERHLRGALAEFFVHFHREHSHQGPGNELIDGDGGLHPGGRVQRRQRLGGLLSYYYRAA
jgi:putative transposase